MKAQKKLREGYYGNYTRAKDYWLAFLEYEHIKGAIDLSIMAQKLDADRQTLELTVVGSPYGALTYNGNADLLGLAFPSVVKGYDAPTPVQSCRLPVTSAGGCADLHVHVGSQALVYSTGEALDRRTVSLDVKSQYGFDYYPYDTYSVTGVARVSTQAIAGPARCCFMARFTRAAAADMLCRHADPLSTVHPLAAECHLWLLWLCRAWQQNATSGCCGCVVLGSRMPPLVVVAVSCLAAECHLVVVAVSCLAAECHLVVVAVSCLAADPAPIKTHEGQLCLLVLCHAGVLVSEAHMHAVHEYKCMNTSDTTTTTTTTTAAASCHAAVMFSTSLHASNFSSPKA